MPAPFKRQLTSDKDLQLIQDNVQNALNPMQAIPMLGGNVLTGVTLGSTQTAVAHGLDHVLQYWILIDQNGDARVWRSAPSDSKFLYLTASSACTVSLWVN